MKLWFPMLLISGFVLASATSCAEHADEITDNEVITELLPLPDPFSASWQGVLPCSDCEGIDTRLELNRDGDQWRYRLTENYIRAGEGQSFSSEGLWFETRSTLSGQPAAVYLLGDEENPLQRYWRRVDGSLELLDDNQQSYEDAHVYRLQRL